jgi:pSer/pThr/pTyr-binding forkhead associated (FHA) protein
MNIKLIAIGGKKDGMEIPITTPTFLIGRGEGCHIRPQCNFVNQIHCQISVDKGAAAIDDCSGAVGTFVNGEKIKWHTILKHGDRIKVGTMELEVQYAPDEKTEKKPIPKVPPAATRKVVASTASEEEAAVLTWVEGKGEKPKEVKQNVALPTNVAATNAVETPATPAMKGRRYEIEIEGTDLLLAVAIGIMLIVVLCMVWPSIPWPDWHWHPIHWYWVRVVWCWSNWSWFQWGIPATFVALLALLLGIRVWRQRVRQ